MTAFLTTAPASSSFCENSTEGTHNKRTKLTGAMVGRFCCLKMQWEGVIWRRLCERRQRRESNIWLDRFAKRKGTYSVTRKVLQPGH